MRQVGDRLIPVGVTSGRVHTLSPEEAQAEGVDNGGSRRSRRRQQANQNQNFEQIMGMAGQDLEEVSTRNTNKMLTQTLPFLQLMLMEAMRLSMIDHEEHQRKEAEESKKQAAAIAQSEAQLASTSGPSSTEAPSESITHSTSLASSSNPVSIPRSELRGFLNVPGYTPSPSSSFTRTRTPTPSPSPISGSPPRSSDASPSSRNRRTPSPGPFSALTAAMSAVSTATAILANNQSTDPNGTSMYGAADTAGTHPASNLSMNQHKHSGPPLPQERLSTDSHPTTS